MSAKTQVELNNDSHLWIKNEVTVRRNNNVVCQATGKAYTIRDIASELLNDAIAIQGSPQPETGSGEIVQFNNWLDLNKDKVSALREQVVTDVENGEIDPLKLIIAIQNFSKVFIGYNKDKGVKSLVMEMAIAELEKFGKGPHEILNYKAEIAETGVSYDYSHDPIWKDLNEEFESMKQKLKDRENMLKSAKVPDVLKGEDYDTGITPDGEVFAIKRPTKISTTTVKLTLNK